MADAKVTALSELTTVATGDILYIVDDPSGSPTSKKVTVENVQTDWHVGARVYNSGDLTISNGTTTTLTFDSERYDTDTIHSTASNTGRLTATTAGKYVIVVSIRWAANATGVRLLQLRLNGTTLIGYVGQNAISAGTHDMNLVSIYNMSATDYVEARVYQNSGGNLAVANNEENSPEFMMHRIG